MKPAQAQIFDLPFFTPEFRKAWDEWIEYRAQRRLPKYVPVGLRKTFSKLISDCHNNEERAIAIINRAMAANWQGLHPDKAEVVQMIPKIQTNQFMKRPKPNECKPMTDEEMTEWINSYRCKENNILLLPTDIYDWLEKKKIFVLTEKQWNWCLLKAIPFRKQIIVDDIKAERYKESYITAFHKMEETGEFTGDEPGQLRNLAKKIAVSEYLKKK